MSIHARIQACTSSSHSHSERWTEGDGSAVKGTCQKPWVQFPAPIHQLTIFNSRLKGSNAVFCLWGSLQAHGAHKLM